MLLKDVAKNSLDGSLVVLSSSKLLNWLKCFLIWVSECRSSLGIMFTYGFVLVFYAWVLLKVNACLWICFLVFYHCDGGDTICM